MKYIYILTAICFLTVSLKGESGKNPFAKDVNNNVAFELVEGLILLPLTVDGVKGTYILDTGAPHLTLNRKVDKSEFTLVTYGGSHDGQLVEVNDIQYGPILRSDVLAWAMDLSFIEQIVDRPIAGILGADLLSDNDVLIDFESRNIQLLTKKTKNLSLDPTSYDITVLNISGYVNQLPLVNVSINGITQSMIFDTGAAISVLDSDSKRTVPLKSSKTIRINNVVIKGAPFMSDDITHLSNNEEQTIEGILSVSSLNTAKVLLSHSSSRVFLFWPKSSS